MLYGFKTLPKKDGKGRETKQNFLGEGTDSFENLSVHTGQTKHRRVEQHGPHCTVLSNQVQRGLNNPHEIMANESVRLKA